MAVVAIWCTEGSGMPRPLFQRVEIGDDVLPVGLTGKIDEHFGPVNKPARVREILVEVGVVPGDVGLFHSGGEIETGYGSALAPDNAGERRSHLVLPGLGCVANGTVAGYSYSPAMKDANVTWDDAALDKFLASPGGFVHGTKMFLSLPSSTDRQNVIAYLDTLK